MKWVCQNNLGSTGDVEAIQAACVEQGHEFVPVRVIPFSDDIPELCRRAARDHNRKYRQKIKDR